MALSFSLHPASPASSHPQADVSGSPGTVEHPHLSPGPLTSSFVPGFLRFECMAGTVVVLEGHPCSWCTVRRAVTAAWVNCRERLCFGKSAWDVLPTALRF